MILRQFLHSDPVALSCLSGRCKASSAIGFGKRDNPALRIEAEEILAEMMFAEIPSPPPEAVRIRAIDSGRPVTAA